jgi:hypothetical protein
MSKHNVHPDHYKTAGRERQGKAFGQEASRKALAEQHARLAEYSTRSAAAPRTGRDPSGREPKAES